MFHVEPNSEEQLLASPKDNLVSGEVFQIVLDPVTQIAKTDPSPSEKELPAYYKHEAYISLMGTQSSLWLK